MFGLSENSIKWKPNEQTLPLKAEIGFSIMMSIIVPFFLLFLGSVFIYLPWAAGGELSAQIISTVFSIGLIIFGLVLLFARCSVVITADSVEKTDSGLIKKHFRESLSNYGGLERIVRVTSGKNHQTIHEIILRHNSDPKKDITLFNSYSPDKIDDSWNNFSALLKMPATTVLKVQ